MFHSALQTASGQLQEAHDELQRVWNQVREQWQDAHARQFEEESLQRLSLEIQAVIPAITQMSQILAQVLRECSEPEQSDRG